MIAVRSFNAIEANNKEKVTQTARGWRSKWDRFLRKLLGQFSGT